MTLAETLQQKLSDWHPPTGRQDLAIPVAETGWTLNRAAKRLGISRTTLYSKIRKHRLKQSGGEG